LLRNVILDFAQFERGTTADRTRDKMRQRTEKGLSNGGNAPHEPLAGNKRMIVTDANNPTAAAR
jgi:DNA invertase Pin-like site-specific DNA recombinase